LLVKYMPAPETLNQDRLAAMVQRVGNRGFFTHNFIGVWGEAANMRGLVTLCTDIYERPDLVKRISEFLTERAVRRVKHLAQTGVHSILYDQSWVGVGFSPAVYREFMLPYDQQVVRAAQEAGMLVSYHNCGRGTVFLEDMVSTGAEALETLTPKTMAGDFDLADVKRRVGSHITLNGGFNERMFPEATPAQVRDEVKRCLDAAGAGGRYVLRTCGQMMDAAPGTIEAFASAAREFGQN
jgi:uroporphyrinogen-III decarboxylase